MDEQFRDVSGGDAEKKADARILRALQMMGSNQSLPIAPGTTGQPAGSTAWPDTSRHSLRHRSPSIGETTRPGNDAPRGRSGETNGRLLRNPEPSVANASADLAQARAARLEAERRLADASAALHADQIRLEQMEAARDTAEAELRELRPKVETLRAEKKLLEARQAHAASIKATAVSRTKASGKEQAETLVPAKNRVVAFSSDPKPVKWWL